MHFPVDLRAGVEGHVQRNTGPADPHWPHAPLEPGGRPAYWLEHLAQHSLVDAMVLDRAAFAAHEVLHLTRSATRTSPNPLANDPAAVEVLFDGGPTDADRLHAARLLRLPERADLRAVASADSAGQTDVRGGQVLPGACQPTG